MTSTLQKPQMRGLLVSQIKKNLVFMTIISFSAAYLYKISVRDVKQKKYKEFYKTYDAEKKLQIMNEAGLMQSYIPDK